MNKGITIVRYSTLISCFLAFRGWDSIDDEELKTAYWEGYDGGRYFRQNVGRWLKNNKRKCWGFAEYGTKSIHIWVADYCSMKELIELIAHESSHLRKPRFKDKREEEKKASLVERDAGLAYDIASSILEK